MLRLSSASYRVMNRTACQGPCLGAGATLDDMDIVPLLNAHAFLVVERPPEVWDVDGDDVPVVRMLGEMIAAALFCGTPLERVVLRAANVVVEVGSATGPPGGAYVALSIMAPGDWAPEAHWRPDRDGTPLL